MNDIKSIDKEYVANTYARFPVLLERGKGSLVYDETGKEYIDMGSPLLRGAGRKGPPPSASPTTSGRPR